MAINPSLSLGPASSRPLLRHRTSFSFDNASGWGWAKCVESGLTSGLGARAVDSSSSAAGARSSEMAGKFGEKFTKERCDGWSKHRTGSQCPPGTFELLHYGSLRPVSTSGAGTVSQLFPPGIVLPTAQGFCTWRRARPCGRTKTQEKAWWFGHARCQCTDACLSSPFLLPCPQPLVSTYFHISFNA